MRSIFISCRENCVPQRETSENSIKWPFGIPIGPRAFKRACSPGKTKTMSDSAEPRYSLFCKRNLLAFVAVLAAILLPLIYLVTIGEYGTSLAVTGQSEYDGSAEKQPHQPIQIPSDSISKSSVSTNAFTNVLNNMRTILSNNRILMFVITITVILATLAVLLALYTNDLDVDDNKVSDDATEQQHLEEEKRRLEEQIRLESEAKAPRRNYWMLALRAFVVNFVLSVVYILILRFGFRDISVKKMAALLFACSLLQQGFSLLLLTTCTGIYNVCYKILKSSTNRAIRAIALGLGKFVLWLAKISMYLCFPVAMIVSAFTNVSCAAVFTKLDACKDTLASYRVRGDPLVKFEWNL